MKTIPKWEIVKLPILTHSNYGQMLIVDEGGDICHVFENEPGEQRAIDNARLIAAAPDLLEALKTMVEAVFYSCDGCGVEDVHVAAVAAIAKAECGV